MNEQKEEEVFSGTALKNRKPIAFIPYNYNNSKKNNKVFIGKQGRGMNFKIKHENEEVDEKL